MSTMNPIARVEDLQIDVQAKLTSDAKAAFVKLIVKEMDAKRSLYHAQFEQEQRSVMEDYRKKAGYYTLKHKLDAELARHTAFTEHLNGQITDLGLKEDGDVIHTWETKGKPKAEAGRLKLERLLEAVRKNAPDQALESKLVARMHLATTVGEAVVILHQVMGNGVMPPVTVNQLKALPAPTS